VRTQSIFTVCFALLSNLEIAQNAGIAQPLSDQKENSPPAYEASSIEENIPELNLPMGAIVLKKGTEVKIAFAQSLSSKHATIGEKVELRVTEDVRVAEKVAIPKGARAIGLYRCKRKKNSFNRNAATETKNKSELSHCRNDRIGAVRIDDLYEPARSMDSRGNSGYRIYSGRCSHSTLGA
jgi:hypothetical protein